MDSQFFCHDVNLQILIYININLNQATLVEANLGKQKYYAHFKFSFAAMFGCKGVNYIQITLLSFSGMGHVFTLISFILYSSFASHHLNIYLSKAQYISL